MLDIKLKLKPGHTSERSWMEPSPLRALFWNITYNCTYNCSICFTDSGTRHSDELTTEEAHDVVEKIYQAGIRDLIISGGEPFIREDIVDILVHMGERSINARIASNGSLLTDDILDTLGSTPTPHYLRILVSTLPFVFSFSLLKSSSCTPAGNSTTPIQEPSGCHSSRCTLASALISPKHLP